MRKFVARFALAYSLALLLVLAVGCVGPRADQRDPAWKAKVDRGYARHYWTQRQYREATGTPYRGPSR